MILETNCRWERAASPSLSVVIIGYRSALLLARAIESLVRHSAGSDWELVLVLNGDHPEVGAYAARLLRAEILPVALVKVSERRPGAGRNVGVRASRGSLLFFLDDDVECFQDVIGAARELFRDETIDAAGGANLTPPNSSALARATGAVMASRLGAAGMRRRYRVGAEGTADEHGLILCNLVVRKSMFERERGFALNLISNEENVLLQRLAFRGARLWSTPRLAVFHHRRESWSGLGIQSAKYGAGRAQNLLLVPESFRTLYVLPMLLLFACLATPFLALSLGSMAILPLALYFALSAVQSFTLFLASRDPAQLLGVAVLPFIHVSYGLGFTRALLTWALRREELREHAI